MTKLEIQPGKLDLKLYGGDDVPIVAYLTDDVGDAVVVDGTLKATIYTPYTTPNSRTLTVTAGDVAGAYVVTFDAATTRALAGYGDLAWDLQLHSTAGQTRTLLAGIATIAVEVTND